MNRVPPLHLISDRRICPVERFPALAGAAAAGGVGAVHLREPGLDDQSLLALAEATKPALAAYDAKLLINGNVDVAVTAGADGVHLPERMIDELPGARNRLPAGSLIGVSVHSAESAIAAAHAGADYVIAGNVFETASKPGVLRRGLSFVREVSSAVQISMIAIGGLTPENVADVIRAGAWGAAVLSGILQSDDPTDAARRFSDAIQEAQDDLI